MYGALTGELPGVGRTDLGMFVERVQNVRDGWEWACEACADERDISVEAAQLGGALRAVHARLAQAFGSSVVPGAEVAAAISEPVLSASTCMQNSIGSSPSCGPRVSCICPRTRRSTILNRRRSSTMRPRRSRR